MGSQLSVIDSSMKYFFSSLVPKSTHWNWKYREVKIQAMSKWAFYWHFFDYREVKTTEDKFIQVGQCSRSDVYKLNVAGLYPGQNNCIAKTTVTFHVKYNNMLVLVFLAYISATCNLLVLYYRHFTPILQILFLKQNACTILPRN